MNRRDAARALDRTGVGALMRRLGRWRGVLVLTYHRIGDASASPYDRALISASASGFERQLRELSRSAELITPHEVLDAIGRRGRQVMITFDDGYRDNFEVAFPLLRAHGAPAAFFISSGLIDRPRIPWWDEIAWMVRMSARRRIDAPRGSGLPVEWDEPCRDRAIDALTAAYKQLPGSDTEQFLDDLAEATGSGRCDAPGWEDAWMTWDMVRELRDAGMTIGGHTVDHPVLSRLDEAGQEEQIAGNAARLRDELGIAMRWFSYPVGVPGTYNAVTKRLLAAHGVEAAFAFAGGVAGRRGVDRLALDRASVGNRTTAADFDAMLTVPSVFAPW